jgi:hypothetical protein
MRWFTLIRSMPLPVIGLMSIFLLVPPASAYFLETPFSAWQRNEAFPAAALALAYWACPLAIAFSLVRKHHWFLPLYVLQCVFLSAHTLLSRGQATEIQIARILLIGLMLYVGVLMGNRNFLYPLLSRQYRLWRRSVRFRVGRAVTLGTGGEGRGTPALLFDCSNTGVQVSVHPSDMTDRLRHMKRGDRFELRIPAEALIPETKIAMEVAWRGETDGTTRLGCKTLDRRMLKAYVAREKDKQKATVKLPVPKGYTIDQDIQETALVLWLVCIALSFALPAFARLL